MNDPGSARLDAGTFAASVPAGGSPYDAMRALLPWAEAYADAPVSGFRVGAVVLGGSGAAYAGANLEFAGAPLAASVHAEQAAVANAWLHGERCIAAIAASAVPCGHCRQFLNELPDAAGLAVVLPDGEVATLAELLPHAFGPADLGAAGRLLEPVSRDLRIGADADALARAARDAAAASYAPYTGAAAGIALALPDGTVVTGRSAECAAYNPSLPALQCAVVVLALSGRSLQTVTDAVLVEAAGRAEQRAAAEALLAACGAAPLRYVRASSGTG